MKEHNRASRFEPLLKVADLDAFPDDDGNRYELIEGELFVSRAPGIPHQRVLLNLQVHMATYLKANPLGILVPGAGAIFSEYDAVIPDLVFVSHERWNDVVTGERFTGAVDLVIEVVSPGSANRRRDFEAKRSLYGKYGVDEYWIVDCENQSVSIFRQSGKTLAETQILWQDQAITSTILPGFHLLVQNLFSL